MKREALGHPAPLFAASFVVGLPTSKTFGHLTVGTHGTRSIREACALHPRTNGLRHSAFDADSGHYIPIGMYIEDSDFSIFGRFSRRKNLGGLPLTGRSGSLQK